jgi:disulfide bond formation protein DsbB
MPAGGCTLTVVHNRLAKWVIAALVMSQLVSGLQPAVAQALVASHDQQMSGMEAGHCPVDLANDSRTDLHKNPAHKHDCCHSVGCQCHWVQSPGVLGLALMGIAVSASLLLPVCDARHPVARTNELFRPPIA